MPENPSQFHTQAKISDFSEMTAAEIKKKIAENGHSENSEMEVPTPPNNNEDNKEAAQNSENTTSEIEKKPRPSRNNGVEENPRSSSEDNQTDEGAHAQNSEERVETPEEGTEKELPNNREAILSKIISTGDPVLLNGVKDFDTPGAWFYTGDAEMITDTSNHKSQVKIIFKRPNGEVAEERQVTWSEITPAYNSDEEYTHALRTIREKYEHVKKQGNDEAYEKHLAKLGAQIMYFSLRFDQRQKEKIKEAKAMRNAA